MVSIILIVFFAAFLVVFLLLFSTIAGSPRDREQTMARLDAIAGNAPPPREPEVFDILREENLSDIPWLNELLQSFNIFPAMRRTLHQADVKWPLGTVLISSAAVWAVVALAFYLRSGIALISLLAGAAMAVIPWLLVLRQRKKRFMEFEEKLPEALDLIVSAIRAGHGFTSAVGLASKESAEPIAGEFRQCFDEQNFGLDLRRAMSNLAERMPLPDVQLIVSATLIQKESGGNLAEVLEKVAYIIRERFRLKRQVRVHTAQGRLTGWILALMPVVLGLLLFLLNPGRMAVLWNRPIGLKLIWGAVFMDLIGAIIIRKIVRTNI
jgi:tight adherence protein B